MMEYSFLKNKILNQYEEDYASLILDGFNKKRYTTFRINTLLSTKKEVLDILSCNNFCIEEFSIYPDAYIVKNKTEIDLMELDLFKDGKIYLQSLSSMLPVLILNPKENTDILDMAAAPGGKTCQIAALTNNKSRVTAVELNKIRAQRLQYNINKQHVTSVSVLNQDARKLDDFFSFDQILLDAPCSGSGTHTKYDKDPFKGFSEALINKSVKSQKELLTKALKLLKKGSEMVYSTCSILEEENEEILKRTLNNNFEIVPIEINDKNLIKLPTKIDGTLCVCPNEYFEGFFIAKIRRVK